MNSNKIQIDDDKDDDNDDGDDFDAVIDVHVSATPLKYIYRLLMFSCFFQT